MVAVLESKIPTLSHPTSNKISVSGFTGFLGSLSLNFALPKPQSTLPAAMVTLKWNRQEQEVKMGSHNFHS